jgi:hypothetical protein
VKYARLVRYWTNAVDLPAEPGDKSAHRATRRYTIESINVFRSSQLAAQSATRAVAPNATQ